MDLPRSTFSMHQIDMMHWLLKANSASQVPSSKTIQQHNAALHNMCGVRSLQYTGTFGNTFYVNSLADLISQVCQTYLLTVWFYVSCLLATGNGQLLRLGGPSAKACLGGGSLDHLMEAKLWSSAPNMRGGTTATRKELHMNDKQQWTAQC